MSKVPSLYNWQESSCTRCPRLVASRTRVVVATPSAKGGLLVIGEAPGGEEDEVGEGFVGLAGKNLDKLLANQNISRSSYGRANVCRCRPPNNDRPTVRECDACLPYLADLIWKTKPSIVLAVGATPTAVFFGSGTLHSKLKDKSSADDWSSAACLETARPEVREALAAVRFVVAMPHTSPQALNRYAPTGERWAKIAGQQVALAARLLKPPTSTSR